MKTLERRQAILEMLCERRYDTFENLAFEFSVSKMTIYRDVLELSLSHPIYTQSGRHGGGIYVADGYYLGKQYLSNEQKGLLESLVDMVDNKDKKILESIIAKFGAPREKRKLKWRR